MKERGGPRRTSDAHQPGCGAIRDVTTLFPRSITRAILRSNVTDGTVSGAMTRRRLETAGPNWKVNLFGWNGARPVYIA
jgi:hypothetical protein